jgi:hypothetical protein
MSDNHKLKLSREDSEAFIKAVLNPPPPNEVLKSAALRHQQTINQILSSHERY